MAQHQAERKEIKCSIEIPIEIFALIKELAQIRLVSSEKYTESLLFWGASDNSEEDRLLKETQKKVSFRIIADLEAVVSAEAAAILERQKKEFGYGSVDELIRDNVINGPRFEVEGGSVDTVFYKLMDDLKEKVKVAYGRS